MWKKYDLSYQKKTCALWNQNKPQNKKNINQCKLENIGTDGKDPCKLPSTLTNATSCLSNIATVNISAVVGNWTPQEFIKNFH